MQIIQFKFEKKDTKYINTGYDIIIIQCHFPSH